MALSMNWSVCARSVAVVEGFAVGAGLAIANACDIRVAASGSRFGVPIARTLGNCLSAANLRRLCATLGVSWVKRMLVLAETPTAETLLPVGYLAAVVPRDTLDEEIERLCNQLIGNAPLSIAATRENLAPSCIRRGSRHLRPDKGVLWQRRFSPRRDGVSRRHAD